MKRDRELKCALLRIAQSRSDVRNETEWTERQCYLLMRTIDQIITEKLRERRWVKMIGPWREVKHAPNQEWAVKLVRLKQREQMIGQVRGHSRMNQEMAIRDGADAACDDLSPVEQRAVELVCGAKRKTRKNLIEERAIRLAECVLDDWFRTARPRGRPRGAGTLGSETELHRIPVSIAEIIKGVAPLIEDLSGSIIKISPSNPAFAALVAAVRTCQPCDIDTVARVFARVKKCR